jgi:Trypsin-co-occurring domain 2
MSELGLSEAIGQLRREIGQAMQSARTEPLQFQLDSVDLELQVQLMAKGGVKGESKWVVVSVAADVGAERTRTHRVKLTLKPSFQGDDQVRVR